MYIFTNNPKRDLFCLDFFALAKDVHLSGFPVVTKPDVLITGNLTRFGWFAGIGRLPDLAVTLSLMVVFVVDREAALFQNWTNPTHAVVTIVVIALDSSFQEQSQRRAGKHVNSIRGLST